MATGTNSSRSDASGQAYTVVCSWSRRAQRASQFRLDHFSEKETRSEMRESLNLQNLAEIRSNMYCTLASCKMQTLSGFTSCKIRKKTSTYTYGVLARDDFAAQQGMLAREVDPVFWPRNLCLVAETMASHDKRRTRGMYSTYSKIVVYSVLRTDVNVSLELLVGGKPSAPPPPLDRNEDGNTMCR